MNRLRPQRARFRAHSHRVRISTRKLISCALRWPADGVIALPSVPIHAIGDPTVYKPLLGGHAERHESPHAPRSLSASRATQELERGGPPVLAEDNSGYNRLIVSSYAPSARRCYSPSLGGVCKDQQPVRDRGSTGQQCRRGRASRFVGDVLRLLRLRDRLATQNVITCISEPGVVLVALHRQHGQMRWDVVVHIPPTSPQTTSRTEPAPQAVRARSAPGRRRMAPSCLPRGALDTTRLPLR